MKQVAAVIAGKRTNLTIDGARELAKRALKFKQERDRLPSITSPDAWEKRTAEGVAFLTRMKAEAPRGYRCSTSFNSDWIEKCLAHHAARRESEASGKLTALFHFVDRAVSERNYLAQLLSTDSPPDWNITSVSHHRPLSSSS